MLFRSVHDGELAGVARRLIGVGLAVMMVGVLCLGLRTTAELPLRDGQRGALRDRFGRTWSFASQGTSRFERPPNQYVLAFSVAPQLSGKRLPLLTAEQREYVDGRGESRGEPMMVAGYASGLLVDAQLALLDVGPGGAVVRLTLWPLRSALNVGGAILWMGALLLEIGRAHV